MNTEKQIEVNSWFHQRQGNKPYPPGNSPNFEEYYFDNYEPHEGRVYLPVLWTGYYIHNNYGRNRRGMVNLQNMIKGLDKSLKYYTIVQYDDGILSDVTGLNLKVFGMGCAGDYQLPLICQPHKFKFSGQKQYFASFVGRNTHPIRKKVFELKDTEGCFVTDQHLNLYQYSSILSSSVFSLCPRGYGKTSFRIAESLQYGAIPVYISNEHLIPHGVRFEDYGLVLKPTDDIIKVLNEIPESRIKELQQAGKEVYEKYYTFEACRDIVIKNTLQ